ncbi:uncharacterized protein LY89DRAFT_788841 [Mollisia scopiformis]|uniref:HOOK N-terminal domain-containing protein n=1 Tax=Mollisia scopiformis TaxID=149040 RepID=A0A132B7X0_MOLSC|nr:uncharacterized protein LY89DRAFT_788841 [Mollisia scopiformis]KUJ08461.1 hypothetical protein LY89DRAFT_788841 [Mollisia scopiformis]
MKFTPAAEAALLKWANLFPLDSRVESVADLSDGYALSRMLEDIDPQYAVPIRDFETVKNSNSPSKWLIKKKNLGAVSKHLFRYIQEQCQSLNSMALEDPIDFNAIAEYNDEQNTYKLLAVFLMAAVKGARIAYYVETIMTKLDKVTQAEIASIIQTMEETAPSSNTPPSGSSHRHADHDLALEEEIATLRKDLDESMKKNADVFSRLDRLTVNNDNLQNEIKQRDATIEALESASRGDQSDYIVNLQTQIQEQNQLIERQETQADIDKEIKESYHKELLSLRPTREKLVEAEDRLKELTQANLELERKANQVDHFKRKLERHVAIENENLKLRDQIEVLEANQVDFDKVHDENAKVKNTLQEYQRKFESYELQVVEISNQKHLLEGELRLQTLRIEQIAERQQHDEKFISDLQEQLRTGPASPNSPTTATGGLNLEQELEQSDDPTRNYTLEISRLRSEIKALKEGDRRTDNANIRVDLAESERVRKRIEDNFRDLTERNAITQEQLSAVISNSKGELLVQPTNQLSIIGPLHILTEDFHRNEALAHTRKLYLEASQELSTLKTKLSVVQNDLASRDREIMTAKADLSAIDRDELDAIQTLRTTNGIITTSLENDLLVLRKQHQDLTTDFEVQKSQLLDTLLSKDRLMHDLASLKERTGLSDQETVESAKARSTKETELAEQITKKDALIEDLQRKLKSAEDATPDAQKAANETMIKNLARENALIATAWYDLTSRLQSNHVVLQRRQDAPRSWLNKQRQMVQATGGRR